MTADDTTADQASTIRTDGDQTSESGSATDSDGSVSDPTDKDPPALTGSPLTRVASAG